MRNSSSCGPFPVHLLPPRMAEMVSAIALSAGCGNELPAVTALGVVGCAIGPGINVCNYLTRELPTPANVYVVVVGISGGGKSRNGGPLFEPLFAYQDRLRSEFTQQHLPLLKAQEKLLEKEIKVLEKQAESESEKRAVKLGRSELPSTPAAVGSFGDPQLTLVQELAKRYGEVTQLRAQMSKPQVVMEDFTVQILVRAMSRNQGKMLIISSDARETVSNLLGRYNRGKTDESILLKGWSAERYTYDRKGENGELVSEAIERCLVGIVLMIQDDKAEELVESKSLASGGFLPRTQIVFTDIDPALPSTLKPLPDDVRASWNAFIDGLLVKYYAASRPFSVELSEDAQIVWNAYADSKVQERNDGANEAFSFRSRDAEAARRYAGILHAGRYSDDADRHPIGLTTMESAIQIVEWFDWHRQKVVDFHQADREGKLMKKLQELKVRFPRGFSLREACRKRLAGSDDSERNKKVLDRLVEKGELLASPDDRGEIFYSLP